jgi:hypothetical protein
MHGSPTLAAIDNNFKFLTNLSEDGRDDMLFDLVKDPSETHNIISEYPRVARTLKAKLGKWTESCKASHAGADYGTAFEPVNEFPAITGTWRK